MAHAYITYSVEACCYLGIVINVVLLYVAGHYSQKMGYFKYLLMTFSAFEMCFSVVALVTQPMFYGFDRRLMLLSQNTWVSRGFSQFITGVYCAFYEIWLGLVVILFAYKYIVLCRQNVSEKIKLHIWPKILIGLLYFLHLGYSFVCGLLWCAYNRPTEPMKKRIKDVFHPNLKENEFYGVASATFLNEHNEMNIAGFFSVVDHFVLIILSFSLIIYCGWKIWKNISGMQNAKSCIDYKRNLQIFYTLVLQAAIPFAMYNIPTALFIGDTLLEDEPVLLDWIPLWSLLMSLPKVIDPIVILLVIKDYRTALKRMISRDGKVGTYKSSLTARTPVTSA